VTISIQFETSKPVQFYTHILESHLNLINFWSVIASESKPTIPYPQNHTLLWQIKSKYKASQIANHFAPL